MFVFNGAPAPTLTSITPSSGMLGTTFSVTLAGTNFVSGATAASVSGEGVTVGPVNVASSTSLTTTFAIAASAAPGARNVTVMTSGGSSNPLTFGIEPPPPACTIQLNKITFVNGNPVIAQVVQVANPASASRSIEFKFWLIVPGSLPMSYARGGADDSVVLPPGFNQNIGPVTLGIVNSGLPRGAYAFNCTFVDPVTGSAVAIGGRSFTIQ